MLLWCGKDILADVWNAVRTCYRTVGNSHYNFTSGAHISHKNKRTASTTIAMMVSFQGLGFFPQCSRRFYYPTSSMAQKKIKKNVFLFLNATSGSLDIANSVSRKSRTSVHKKYIETFHKEILRVVTGLLPFTRCT